MWVDCQSQGHPHNYLWTGKRARPTCRLPFGLLSFAFWLAIFSAAALTLAIFRLGAAVFFVFPVGLAAAAAAPFSPS